MFQIHYCVYECVGYYDYGYGYGYGCDPCVHVSFFVPYYYIYPDKIMKFEILDARTHAHAHAHAHESSSSTKYQYLDELLDRTFITDYFLDKSSKDANADADDDDAN
jgi:hypothetical protein